MHHRHAAFTLMELAIVLVIIGLLVGGLMAGQMLVHAAELRAITTESERYKASVNAFRDKYLGLPGDITSATRFWGALNATPATCDTTPATTGTATCNGDGDQRVGLMTGLGYEPLRFWQQLNNAGLVEGFYTGTGISPPSYTVAARANIPASRYPGAAWCVRFRPSEAGDASYFNETSSNHLFVFGSDTGANPCEGKILSPIDALGVDIKTDDGKPATGSIETLWRSGCTNSTSASDMAASYKGTDATLQCALFLRKVF